MKRIFLLLAVLCSFPYLAKPDEGMWIPMLLKQLNEEDMQKNGLKLTAEDIYNVNKSSIKDAVAQFAGGCTAEMISPDGLLLTNHHCGYSSIQSHSSVSNDYLTNGFWAMSKEEELPNPGLKVTFIVRMEDVTKKILSEVAADASEKDREEKVKQACVKVQNDAIQNTHFEATVKSFFYGTEYYMFVTETFKDVRMVGAPPSSIGQFGGDTDNWMWPRHTGDFSIFRVYAGPDNKPAEFSPDNKPYHPKNYLPISLDGVNEGDFTMVMGFPGKTKQYLTSHAIKLIVDVSNPARVNIRENKLAIWAEDMKASDEIRIKYAAKYAYISNYHKKWIGETKGLKRINAVSKKDAQEQEFVKWANDDLIRKLKYGSLIDDFKNAYAGLEKVTLCRDYYQDAVFGIEILSLASRFYKIVDQFNSHKATINDLQSSIVELKEQTRLHFKDLNVNTDKKVFASLIKMYQENVDTEFHPFILTEIKQQYKGDFEKLAEHVFKKSALSSEEKTMAILNNFNENTIKMLLKDPAFKIMMSFMKNYNDDVATVYDNIYDNINRYSRIYIEGLKEMSKSKKLYPDANSTLRVSYGKVADYEPMDGIVYNHYTTLDGIIQKSDSKNQDFIVPEKLVKLQEDKDYGQYADNSGELKVCFIASNHITGGNSGSPIMNGNGYLIGTVFDMNWEGVVSDIMYDESIVRSIAVDIRYVLFVIDKFAGAGYLLNEMTIVKTNNAEKNTSEKATVN